MQRVKTRPDSKFNPIRLPHFVDASRRGRRGERQYDATHDDHCIQHPAWYGKQRGRAAIEADDLARCGDHRDLHIR